MRRTSLLIVALFAIPAAASAQENAALAWTLPWDEDWVTAITFVGKNACVVAGNNVGHMVAWDLPESPKDPRSEAGTPIRRPHEHGDAALAEP